MDCANLLNKLAYKCCKGKCGCNDHKCKYDETEINYLGNVTINSIYRSEILTCLRYKINCCERLSCDDIGYLRDIVQLEIASIHHMCLLSYHISVSIKQNNKCIVIKVVFHNGLEKCQK